MKLQILINHYNEEPAIIGRLLKSIEEQNFDRSEYEVLIASDGVTHKLSWDFLAQFPFTIKYYVLPHRGVCATRNTLLDESFSDYVMFCDADDMFSKNDGLSLLVNAAYEKDADIVGSRYSLEYMEDESFKYVDYIRDIVRVHGKIFRRKYILDEQIRYPDHVISNGDMCFLWLAFHMTDKIVWLDDNFYIWKYNPKSVTRSVASYKVEMFDRKLACYAALSEELIKRNRRDLYDCIISANIMSAYISAASDDWKTFPKEHTKRAEKAMCEFIKEFRSYYDLIDEDYKYKKYNRMLIKKRTYGPPTKYKGIGSWMDEIVEKYG